MPVVAPISNFETNVSRKGKVGRPAKAGERYPSGQLKRDTGPAPAVVKRTFDKALRGGGDPLVGTSLGLLFMTGKITVSEFSAGVALASLWGRYDRAVGMPGRFTLSPDYGTARMISSREPLSDAAVAAVKDRFAKTMGLLGVGWVERRSTVEDVLVAGSAGEVKRRGGALGARVGLLAHRGAAGTRLRRRPRLRELRVAPPEGRAEPPGAVVWGRRAEGRLTSEIPCARLTIFQGAITASE